MEIVNGFPCKNCTDAEYAKKNIDPAHPKDGPNGVDSPQKQADKASNASHGPAVTFGGVLAALNPPALSGANPSPSSDQPPRPDPSRTTGSVLDVRA